MALITAHDTTVPAVVQARTALRPEAAFDAIVPIDLSLVFTGWHGIFPGVRGAKHQTGSWDHVGVSRNPVLTDGSTATETLVEYTRPSSFAYTLVEFTNVLGRIVEGVRGEWTYAPDGDGSLIRWTYEFKPLRGRAAMVRWLLVPLWRRYMIQSLAKAIEVAERIAAEREASAAVLPAPRPAIEDRGATGSPVPSRARDEGFVPETAWTPGVPGRSPNPSPRADQGIVRPPMLAERWRRSAQSAAARSAPPRPRSLRALRALIVEDAGGSGEVSRQGH